MKIAGFEWVNWLKSQYLGARMVSPGTQKNDEERQVVKNIDFWI